MHVSKCFTYALAKCRHIYSRARTGIGDRLCIITAGTLQKEILSPGFYVLRCSVCNATTATTYAVTPINIDQAQQWPAGKRIDILYFPPALTGCLRAVCYSNCDTGTNCRICCPRRDSTHDEMLMDESDTVDRFMNGWRSKTRPKCR